MVSDVTGDQGVAVYVSYESGADWGWPFASGMIKNTYPGWYPSKPIMLHAGQLRGNHLVRLTLVAYSGEYQLYNLFIDPRRGH
jgi:hypothetical protein